MSGDMKVKDIVEAILNPVMGEETTRQENWGEFNDYQTDFSLKQEVLPEGSAIVEETISEVALIDLKGNHFKFPGTFKMERSGDKTKFIAIS